MTTSTALAVLDPPAALVRTTAVDLVALHAPLAGPWPHGCWAERQVFDALAWHDDQALAASLGNLVWLEMSARWRPAFGLRLWGVDLAVALDPDTRVCWIRVAGEQRGAPRRAMLGTGGSAR